MAAISEEATHSLSSSFDHICDVSPYTCLTCTFVFIYLFIYVFLIELQEFKNAIAEMQTLNSNYNAEVKKRNALQFTIKNLQSGFFSIWFYLLGS